MDSRAAALAFDLRRLDAAFLADPFPLYRALREHDPVHRMPDGSYFLSRYDDCAAVYRDAATWSSDMTERSGCRSPRGACRPQLASATRSPR